MKVSAAQLRKIVGGKAPLAVQAAEAFTEYSERFDVANTPLRAALFWGQVAVESDYLKTATEYWGPTEAQKRYEGRADLGNTQPGDGARFKGHSLIQVTGRANHRDCTAWVKQYVPDCPDFVLNPEKLAEFPWAMLGAFWYWSTRKLDLLADKGDVRAVTKKVNGGTNALAERGAATERAKAVFGVNTAPEAAQGSAGPVRVWAEDNLAKYEIEAIQKRLRALMYYQVGKVDGIWGPSTAGALIAMQTQAGITADGHWGPQTKAALDDDANARKIPEARANTTAADLRAQGSAIAIGGNRITWNSVLQIALGLFGVLQYMMQNWNGDLSALPFPLNMVVPFIPPQFVPIAIVCLNVYQAVLAKGVVKARVIAEQTGLHNGEPDPAPSPPVTQAPDTRSPPWPFNILVRG